MCNTKVYIIVIVGVLAIIGSAIADPKKPTPVSEFQVVFWFNQTTFNTHELYRVNFDANQSR